MHPADHDAARRKESKPTPTRQGRMMEERSLREIISGLIVRKQLTTSVSSHLSNPLYDGYNQCVFSERIFRW
jgi:hypothetical protein